MIAFTIRNAKRNYRTGRIRTQNFFITLRAADMVRLERVRDALRATGADASNADVFRWGLELMDHAIASGALNFTPDNQPTGQLNQRDETHRD